MNWSEVSEVIEVMAETGGGRKVSKSMKKQIQKEYRTSLLIPICTNVSIACIIIHLSFSIRLEIISKQQLS